MIVYALYRAAVESGIPRAVVECRQPRFRVLRMALTCKGARFSIPAAAA